MTALGTGVVSVDPRSDDRWHSLATSERGSLFTSPPWIRAVCDSYDFTPQARLTTDAAGRPTDGFAWVPISDIRGDRIVSLPFSDRAEPIVSDPETWSQLSAEALSAGVPFTIRCLEDAAPTVDPRLLRSGEAAWQATPLGLPPPELLQSFSSAARRNLAAAQRNGVTAEAETGFDAVRAYHRLHVSTRKHKYRL